MIVLATPNYGGFRPWYCASLFETARVYGADMVFRYKVSPYLGEARDFLCGVALAEGATGILFVDADMAWHPHDVRDLLAEAAKRPAAVTGAFYPARGNQSVCVGAPLDGKELEMLMDRPAVRAHHLGGGFLWIPRQVLEQLGGPEFFPVGYAGGAFRGEDVGFSMRCHAADVELWGMGSLDVGHPFESGPRSTKDWLRDWKGRR